MQSEDRVTKLLLMQAAQRLSLPEPELSLGPRPVSERCESSFGPFRMEFSSMAWKR